MIARRHPCLGSGTARAAVAVAVALALASGAATAGELSGNAMLSYDDNVVPDVRTQGFNQRYELAYDQALIPPALEYRLALRYTDYALNQSLSELESRTQARELQPRLQLRSRLPFGTAVGSYDVAFQRTVLDPNGLVQRSLLHRAFGTADLTLPPAMQLRLYGSLQSIHDVDLGSDTRSVVLDGVLTQNPKPFTWLAGLAWRGAGSDASNTSQGIWTPRGSVGFDGATRGGRAALSLHYTAQYQRTELRVGGRAPVSQVVPVVPSAARYGLNPLPSDDTGHPLSPLPDLLDGNLEVPTGIALGLPDGQSFQNLALDLGRIQTVDEVRVVVRNATGFLVPTGGPVTWAAYASADGVLWDPVAASSSFDPTLSLYDVRFLPVTARFVKVVSLGINDVPTYVTELQAFEARTITPGTSLVEGSFVENATARASVRPHRKVLLSVDGGLNHALAGLHRTDPSTESADWLGTGAAAFGPYGVATYTVQHTERGVLVAAGPRARSDASSAGVQWQFLPTLETHAAGVRSHEEIGIVRSQSVGATAGGSASPSRFLSFRLDGGVGRQQVEPDATESTYWNVFASSYATLTRELQVQLLASVVEGRIRLPSPSGFTPISQLTNNASYQAMVAFNPSASLQLAANLAYVRTDLAEGLLQAYRAYWYPFPGGAFALNVSLDQSFDALTGTRQTRLSVLPRWRLNRHVALEAIYTLLGTDALRFGDSQQLTVTLNVSF